MKHPLNRLRAFPLKGDDSLAAGRPLLAVSGEIGYGTRSVKDHSND